ncbi:hypothetical protein PVAG01_04130 [Phlyctema vagabunda]|uniref:C2H2-type domain-containing protein n=1 Tax=Phlyctema vagabunda TaxID=108571 RepID=A0ABR4PNF3_9HELO
MQPATDDNWTNEMTTNPYTFGNLLFPDLGFEGLAEVGHPYVHAPIVQCNPPTPKLHSPNGFHDHEPGPSDYSPVQGTDLLQPNILTGVNRGTDFTDFVFNEKHVNLNLVGLGFSDGATASNNVNLDINQLRSGIDTAQKSTIFDFLPPTNPQPLVGDMSFNGVSLTTSGAYYGPGVPHANDISEPSQFIVPTLAPVNIGQPQNASPDDRHSCDSCEKSFTRNGDLNRHVRRFHTRSPAAHYCPVPGCNKSRAPFRGYTRDDKVKEHYRKKHVGITSTVANHTIT